MKRLLKRGTVKAFLVLLISMAGMTKCLAYDNLADGEFDLYRLNESPANNGNEWENYKNPIHTDGFKLVNGQGYLYANQDNGLPSQPSKFSW